MMTTIEKRKILPGDPTTVMFGDREVQAVVEHVSKSGWAICRVVGDYPDIPWGYIAAKRI